LRICCILKNSDYDKFELSFDCHAALSSNNDPTFEIIFVKSEKVEDSLVKRKTAAALTSQGKKVKKIYIEPSISYPKYRVVHPPRNLPPKRFIPTCHHCGKVGHIRPNCFKLKPHVHKK
jgi:hypothetical protein